METKSGKIFSLIPKIMADIKAIGKDQKNDHQRYYFRGIDDMYNAIHPALVKHGVFCVPQVQSSQCSELESTSAEGKQKISYRSLLTIAHRFYAEDGSFIEVVTLGEGIDTSDKASNKAMSAAMKYAFIELFSIPTEDIEDSDRESPDAGKSKAPEIKSVAQVNPKPAIVTSTSNPIHCEQPMAESQYHNGWYCRVCKAKTYREIAK